MKVTRSENFTPITIVLETEAEAREIWMRLNVNDTYVTEQNRGYGIASNMSLSGDMWSKFNYIYDLRKRR
jgi:hypothetical protein